MFTAIKANENYNKKTRKELERILNIIELDSMTSNNTYVCFSEKTQRSDKFELSRDLERLGFGVTKFFDNPGRPDRDFVFVMWDDEVLALNKKNRLILKALRNEPV